jgi:hypothetical protein
MKTVAYIDEYGNSGLDFSNPQNSTHFIVTAIIVDEKDVGSIEKDLETIRQQNFQTGEIKSSNVGKNDKRREKIIRELCSLDFTIYSVVVDKRELYSDGFRYKKSFYKFIHSLVDRELYKTYPILEIVADEHGGNSFMNDFINYIKTNHIPNLFNHSDFGFVNSKKLSIVQIADFVSGTLARCFDKTKLSDNKDIFLDILKDKIIHIKHWPTQYKPYTYEAKDFDGFDPIISELGLNLAQQFVDSNIESNNPVILDQITLLKYLIFYFKNLNPTNYISTFELIRRITKIRLNSSLSIHYFRSKIIAPLRDKGVIISSCTKGYKLPSCEKDIYVFLNHSNSIISPMISRIQKVHESVLLATHNKVNILDKPGYENLKQLIESK